MLMRFANWSLTTALALGLVVGLSAGPALAQDDADDVAALYAALALPEMVAIMREEGLAYGAGIAQDLFGGAAPAEWTALVDAIYDPARMETDALAALAEATQGQDIGPMIAFFTSEPGSSFIEMEVSARRALLDEDLETMAKDAAAQAMAADTPRYQQIKRFVEVNDLVETNVVGAMNATYAFYHGLMEGGVFPVEMTEEQILTDVWAQEPEIRANTTEWVYSFLMLAYNPLSDADLDAYIAFSETPAGQQLNRAVFGAFDGMFEDISLSLGRAASKFMTGQEL